ncbi:hypothetical protein ACEPAF_9304 [Sanghuangporus sanghuang]
MPSDEAKEYVFHEIGDGNFIRNCYGLEELVSNMEEYCDGFTHLTLTASISLPTSITHIDVEKRVKSAWTALRHFTPAIACKTYRLQTGDKRFAFRYTVPRTEEDVQAWLDETVFFFDKKSHATLYDEHCQLKDGHWWRCSDDHYVLELHVSQMENDWTFSLVFSHNSIDGRNSFAILDLFLGFLDRELQKDPAVSTIDWGNEISRLPPPGAFVPALAKDGYPLEISSPVVRSENGSEEPKITYWLYPTRTTSQRGDVSRLVQFPEETSAKLHALCKKKGYTVTQVVTALSALAHAEAALKTAAIVGSERFQEVSNAFYGASHYLVPWNFINQRPRLPNGYDSYYSRTSTALCTADCVPVSFPMDGIRSCVKVDRDTQSTIRVVDESAFWNVLVRDVTDAWKKLDQSLEGYTARENALHNAFDAFTPQIFDLPALIVSSLGDLDRLGLLSPFVPSPDNEPKTRLVVNDVICGIRIRMPPIMNLFWEYRGMITCHFMASGEYTTSDELALMTAAFEEWTNALIQ